VQQAFFNKLTLECGNSSHFIHHSRCNAFHQPSITQDLLLQGRNRATALLSAAHGGFAHVVRALLQHRADPSVRDEVGF